MGLSAGDTAKMMAERCPECGGPLREIRKKPVAVALLRACACGYWIADMGGMLVEKRKAPLAEAPAAA